MDILTAEQRIGYVFKNKELLRRALTLASADGDFNNQSLEFFGDAVLEFLVSEKIFDENLSEGKLTERRKAIVSDKALAPVSLKLGLDKLLVKTDSDKFNKKAVPSAYEAVVAAIYLDGGMDAARAFVTRTLDFSQKVSEINYKGELQELLQSHGKPRPDYKTKNVGTPQKPEFKATFTINGKKFSGVADRARQAEQNAAQQALEYLKKAQL